MVEGADDCVRQGARQARVHPQGHQQPTEAAAVSLGGGADRRQLFVLVLGQQNRRLRQGSARPQEG